MYAAATGAIYYLRWNGSEWVDADGTGQESVMIGVSDGQLPHFISFSLDSSDRPCIAWTATEYGPYNVYYVRWKGTSWVDADGTGTDNMIAASYGYNTYTSMELDSFDRPHLLDSVGNTLNYVRWDGSAWLEDPGVYVSAHIVDGVIGMGPGNTPYAVWAGGPSNGGLYLLRRLPDPTSTPTVIPTGTPTLTPTATPQPLVLDVKGSFPNPFRQAGTNIVYTLTVSAQVGIEIYTVSGEVVLENADLPGSAGHNAFLWDGRNKKGAEVAAGIYIYRIIAVSGIGEKAEAFGKLAYIR